MMREHDDKRGEAGQRPRFAPFVARRSPVLRRYALPTHTAVLELRQPGYGLAWLAAAAWHAAAPTEFSAVLLAGLSALLLLGLAWARAMARSVHAERELRYAAVQVGDELEESITLHNESRFPVLWAELADQTNVPGYSLTSVRAAESRQDVRWRAHAVCTQRGLFSLGPFEVRLGDPFGVWGVRQVYPQRQTLLVYPPLAPLPPRLEPQRSQPGETRRLRVPTHAESLSALGARAYQPGDPLRRIHWPTTARQDSLFTRVFDPEATSTLWLVPDFDPAVHIGTGPEGSEEAMVVLAASLAAHLLRRGVAVGLLAHTGEVTAIRPQPGPGHLWVLLRALAGLHATSPLAIGAALAQLQAPLSPREGLVVLTPGLDAAWPTALRRAAFRGGAEALLLDPAEYTPAVARPDVALAGPGAAERCAQALAGQGVPARVVRRGEIVPATGTYGELRRWEFITTATGRAVARQTPRSAVALPGLERAR